jgi:hypothetical protein
MPLVSVVVASTIAFAVSGYLENASALLRLVIGCGVLFTAHAAIVMMSKRTRDDIAAVLTALQRRSV